MRANNVCMRDGVRAIALTPLNLRRQWNGDGFKSVPDTTADRFAGKPVTVYINRFVFVKGAPDE